MATSITGAFHVGEDVYWPFSLNAEQAAARGWTDITGMGFLMTIRDEKSMSSTYHQTVVPTVSDGPAFELDVHITDTVNEAIPADDYFIDFWSTDADEEFCWGEGSYSLSPTPRLS